MGLRPATPGSQSSSFHTPLMRASRFRGGVALARLYSPLDLQVEESALVAWLLGDSLQVQFHRLLGVEVLEFHNASKLRLQ